MTVSQRIIEILLNNGASHFFQLPGFHTLLLIAALRNEKTIRIVTGRHETALTFMADGYARASGKTGILIVTPGPGLANCLAGCMEAYGDDVPLLIIHVDAGPNAQKRGMLHGVTSPDAAFKNVTKAIYHIRQKTDVETSLTAAYIMTQQDRKGPVLISVPYGLLEKDLPDSAHLRSLAPAMDYPQQETTPPQDSAFFEQTCTELFHRAEKPLILVGRGVIGTGISPVLAEISSHSSMPVFTTAGAKGVLPEDETYVFGNIMRGGITREIVRSADLVIALGTRLRHVDIARRGLGSKPLIHIDIDERWIDRVHPGGSTFAGNLATGLSILERAINSKRFSWNLKILHDKADKEESILRLVSPGCALTHLLREAAPRHTTVVCDLNSPSYWAEYYFPVFEERRFITPHGSHPTFYSLAAAIGAKLAAPDHPCLALCGDGSLMPLLGEMATITEQNLPLVIFVENNGGFGVLEGAMIDRYHTTGTMSLKTPDFAAMARSFGIKARKVDTLADLKRTFITDVSWEEPFLIELIRPMVDPPWKA